jgi:hypothetical protein
MDLGLFHLIKIEYRVKRNNVRLYQVLQIISVLRSQFNNIARN